MTAPLTDAQAAQHWIADQQRGGWAILYDPTPGGVKNADGTTSFSLRIPALQVTEWVSGPEKVAKDIAVALNEHDHIKAERDALRAERDALAERSEGWAVSFAEKCNEVEAAKSIIRDCLKELDRSQRPSYAWQLRARSALTTKGADHG